MKKHPEDVRSALHQHDRGRRGGRHPRHDSQAAGDLHRKGRQAEGSGEVRDDLSDRGHRHRHRRRRRHSVEGHPDLRQPVRRPRRRSAAADPHRHRAEQRAGALHAVHHRRHRRGWCSASARTTDSRRPDGDRSCRAEAAGARHSDAQDRGRALLPDALDAAGLGRVDSRGARHHGPHGGQRHRRRSDPDDAQEHRARRDDRRGR